MTTIDQMVKAGMHFGHQVRQWNPRMAPYIYAERNGIHIIDLIQTYSSLKQVLQFLTESAAQGKTFLFVGTKKQAARLVAKVALQCNSFYVNQRWLGVMLTNWKTIKTSIVKLNELEAKEKSGELENLPKKEAAAYRKQKERLTKYLGGLKNMAYLPDVVIILGQPEELNAVYECQKLGLRTVTVVDTDCDPTLADLFIPANDDSVASLQLILNEFLKAIQIGQTHFQERQNDKNLKRFNPERKGPKRTQKHKVS